MGAQVLFAASQTTSSVRRGWLLPLSAQCWVQHTQHTTAEQAEQTDTHTHMRQLHTLIFHLDFHFQPRPLGSRCCVCAFCVGKLSFWCVRSGTGSASKLHLSRFPPPGRAFAAFKEGNSTAAATATQLLRHTRTGELNYVELPPAVQQSKQGESMPHLTNEGACKWAGMG